MKKIRTFALLLCFCSLAFVEGCGRQVDYVTITRDDARTGGTLSFVYDKETQTATVGGEGEAVQFSEANDALGLSAGNRIGLKISAPNDEELDVESATLQMNGVTYSSGDFLEVINGQKQRFFNIYPIVSEDDMQVDFSIKWADDVEKQDYHLVVVEGTTFLTGEEE